MIVGNLVVYMYNNQARKLITARKWVTGFHRATKVYT